LPHSAHNLWDELREKLFKKYALKSIDALHRKLEEAILYLERNRAGEVHHQLPLHRQVNLIWIWYEHSSRPRYPLLTNASAYRKVIAYPQGIECVMLANRVSEKPWPVIGIRVLESPTQKN
jgi:hypothetical protein